MAQVIRHSGDAALELPEAPHIPVLLDEVLDALEPASGKRIVDGTFGAGGYTRAILATGADVLAIDRDPSVLEAVEAVAQQFGKQFKFAAGPFSRLDVLAEQSGWDGVDSIVLDIGVSSMQIDQSERGFSFQKDGPLDMRMAQSGPTAADVVNQVARNDLTRIIGLLGEERQASRLSAAIVAQREREPFQTTGQLAKVAENVLGRHGGQKIHPATRLFQALRIFVNAELTELAKALIAAERILRPSGRLVIVTFHSLEDRLVKRFFADRCGAGSGSRHLPEVSAQDATFTQVYRKPVTASQTELAVNPRSRSAKLRAGERTQVLARAPDFDLFNLPRLPDLEGFSS